MARVAGGEPPTIAHGRRAIHLLLGGFWFLLALVQVPHHASLLPGVDPVEVLVSAFADTGGWALASLLAYRLTARIRLEPLRPVRVALMLGGLTVLLVAVRLLLFVPLAGWPTAEFVPYLPSQLLAAGVFVAGGFALQLLRKRHELRAHRARLEEQRSVAARSFLEMQLHPHFLFNVLNSVSSLIHRKPAAAVEMVAKVRRLLRFAGVEDLKHWVTLREEIDLLGLYLELEQVRYRDRLTVHLVLSDDVQACWVPRFILQPIVENAVRHGIAPRGHGSISVRAEHGEEGVRIAIDDDGAGAAEIREGVGLSNVTARIRENFGSRGRVTIRSTPGAGTYVDVQLPAIGLCPMGPGFSTRSPEAEPAETSRLDMRRWLVPLTAVWIVYSALQAVSMYAYRIVSGEPWNLLEAYLRAGAPILSGVGLSWAGILVVNRLPLLDTSRPGSIARHAVAACALTAVAVVFAIGYRLVSGIGPPPSIAMLSSNVFFWSLIVGHLLLILHAGRFYTAVASQRVAVSVLRRNLAQAQINAHRLRLDQANLDRQLSTVQGMATSDPEAADRLLVRCADDLRLALLQATEHVRRLAAS